MALGDMASATRELHFTFHFILITLNLNNNMWDIVILTIIHYLLEIST